MPSAASVTAESATETGVFRSSAAFPLPRLRPVADFVALPSPKRYVTVQAKFGLAVGAAALFLVVAAAVGAGLVVPAMGDVVAWPIAAVLFALTVVVPGMLLAFSLVGLLLDRPPTPTVARPALPVTVAITARNQPRSVVETLEALCAQDYDGPLTLLLVDNGSNDTTIDEATRAAARLGIALRVVVERKVGEAHAAQRRRGVHRHAAARGRARRRLPPSLGRASAGRPAAPLARRHRRGDRARAGPQRPQR